MTLVDVSLTVYISGVVVLEVLLALAVRCACGARVVLVVMAVLSSCAGSRWLYLEVLVMMAVYWMCRSRQDPLASPTLKTQSSKTSRILPTSQLARRCPPPLGRE